MPARLLHAINGNYYYHGMPVPHRSLISKANNDSMLVHRDFGSNSSSTGVILLILAIFAGVFLVTVAVQYWKRKRLQRHVQSQRSRAGHHFSKGSMRRSKHQAGEPLSKMSSRPQRFQEATAAKSWWKSYGGQAHKGGANSSVVASKYPPEEVEARRNPFGNVYEMDSPQQPAKAKVPRCVDGQRSDMAPTEYGSDVSPSYHTKPPFKLQPAPLPRAKAFAYASHNGTLACN